MDQRFLIVAGKGGVGKTTVAAALAVSHAAKGKRVLIAMCNAKERLSAMLGSDLIGEEVMRAAPNIWAVNMQPERALDEYGMLILKSKALYSILFDNKYVRTFFRAVPGMQEWAMLGKAWWHTVELHEDGSPMYDVVILDSPATGHGLDMLRVPKVILEVVPSGLLRRDAERAMVMFQDPKMCSAILVTLPEEMPTTETIELSVAMTKELKIPIGAVVVNGVLPPLFSREERLALEKLAEGDKPIDEKKIGEKNAGDAAILAGENRAARERVQAESLSRLSRDLPVKPIFFPLLFEDAATPSAIRELAKRI